MHQSGGRLHIASEPEAGTTVTLFFPPVADTRPLPARRAGHAVVIDDDPKALNAAATALRTLGYDVTTAPDYASGQALLNAAPVPIWC